MIEAANEFRRQYIEFVSEPGGSLNQRVRMPKNRELVRTLGSLLDTGVVAPGEMAAEVRHWNKVIDQMEWAVAEKERISSLSAEERLIGLKSKVDKFVNLRGVPTEDRRTERHRLLKSIEMVRKSLKGQPGIDFELANKVLNRHRAAVGKKYSRSETGRDSTELVDNLNRRIDQAEKQVEKILNIYRHGDSSDRRGIRTFRNTVITDLQDLLRRHGGKLSTSKVAQAKQLLAKVKSAKAPADSRTGEVHFVSGGLPTLGKNR